MGTAKEIHGLKEQRAEIPNFWSIKRRAEEEMAMQSYTTEQ
jgi:hypothetical protein